MNIHFFYHPNEKIEQLSEQTFSHTQSTLPTLEEGHVTECEEIFVES